MEPGQKLPVALLHWQMVPALAGKPSLGGWTGLVTVLQSLRAQSECRRGALRLLSTTRASGTVCTAVGAWIRCELVRIMTAMATC